MRGWRWLWPWARDARTTEEREPAIRFVREQQNRIREEMLRLQALGDERDLYEHRGPREDTG